MTTRRESLTVQRSLPSERLDTFLRSQFPTVSRGTIQRLIEQGHIRINGQRTKSTHGPRAGERIEIAWPEALRVPTPWEGGDGRAANEPSRARDSAAAAAASKGTRR